MPRRKGSGGGGVERRQEWVLKGGEGRGGGREGGREGGFAQGMGVLGDADMHTCMYIHTPTGFYAGLTAA